MQAAGHTCRTNARLQLSGSIRARVCRTVWCAVSPTRIVCRQMGASCGRCTLSSPSRLSITSRTSLSVAQVMLVCARLICPTAVPRRFPSLAQVKSLVESYKSMRKEMKLRVTPEPPLPRMNPLHSPFVPLFPSDSQPSDLADYLPPSANDIFTDVFFRYVSVL